MQTPAPFDYERATSVDGAIASLVKHDGGRAGSSPAVTACCR